MPTHTLYMPALAYGLATLDKEKRSSLLDVCCLANQQTAQGNVVLRAAPLRRDR